MKLPIPTSQICSLILLTVVSLFLFSCAANPATAFRELTSDNAPRGEFEFSNGGIQKTTDPDGNVTEEIVPVDKIGITNIGAKDTAVMGVKQEYYDTTKMPIETVMAFAGIIDNAVQNEKTINDDVLLLLIGGIQAGANYQIPSVLKSQSLDLDRTNDGEAYYAAEQYRAAEAVGLAKFQTEQARDLAGQGLDTLQSLSPTGAAANILDTLAESVANRSQASLPPVSSTPDVVEVE